MKNPILVLGMLFFCTAAMAQLPNEKLPTFQHLHLVNSEWAHYADKVPTDAISFSTDNERIQLHLQSVVTFLRKKELALTPKQEQQRTRLLDTLAAYGEKGLFPINSFHSKRTPYFIDNYNTHCAVGYLIKASGHTELANTISTEHNYDYIADIHTEGLSEWAQEHGFQVAELAWIQPSYPVRAKSISIGGGVNGEVTCIEQMNTSLGTGIVVTGNFDSIGTLVCNGVGFFSWKTGNWQCLGDGVEGIAEQIDTYEGKLALFGSFLYNDEYYPIATYDDKVGWEYPKKLIEPEHIATICAQGLIAYYIPAEDRSELWGSTSDSTVGPILEIKGRVNAASSYERTYYHVSVHPALVFGGAFDSIKAPDDSVWQASNNLFLVGVGSSVYRIDPVTEHVMSVVLSLEGRGRTMFIGGKCQDSTFDYRENCLVKLLDTLFVPVIKQKDLNTSGDHFDEYQITDMEFIGGCFPRLILAGHFSTTGLMFYSNGLGEYNPLLETVTPFRHVDGYVNTMSIVSNGNLAFGGSFNTGYSYPHFPYTLNNLGRTYDEVGIEERVSGFAIYPNPGTDMLNIELENNHQVQQIRLITSNGVEVLKKKGNSQSQIQLNVQDLPPGMYIAEISIVKGQVLTQKLFVK